MTRAGLRASFDNNNECFSGHVDGFDVFFSEFCSRAVSNLRARERQSTILSCNPTSSAKEVTQDQISQAAPYFSCRPKTTRRQNGQNSCLKCRKEIADMREKGGLLEMMIFRKSQISERKEFN